MPHRQFENYFLSTRDSYGPTAQYICKTSNKYMFDTYQQVVYSLWPRTACWTKCWCWSVEQIYTEKVFGWNRNWPSHLPAGWILERHQLQKPQTLQHSGEYLEIYVSWKYLKLSLLKKKSFGHPLSCATYYHEETKRHLRSFWIL